MSNNKQQINNNRTTALEKTADKGEELGVGWHIHLPVSNR